MQDATPFALSDTREPGREAVLDLYRANKWSAADKPEVLMAALAGSHSLVTAWHDGRLIGLGNAITDGHLVVYYPHLIVHPDMHRRGVGASIMKRMIELYDGFHQHMLVANAEAVAFYRACGFVRAGRTEPMWIYEGNDA